jgi:hypothetical protein
MFWVIAFVAFWAGVVWVWMIDGPKTPLVFAVLWILVWFLIPRLHFAGVLFLPVECILAVILLIIGKYKSMV